MVPSRFCSKFRDKCGHVCVWRGRVLHAGLNLPPTSHPSDESLPLEPQALTVFRGLKKVIRLSHCCGAKCSKIIKNESRTQKHTGKKTT